MWFTLSVTWYRYAMGTGWQTVGYRLIFAHANNWITHTIVVNALCMHSSVTGSFGTQIHHKVQ